ncbi:hypothetical protein O9992_02605 [Vibrio lentus]|nr:hypothetical protein [Vibrio lentus]
MSSRANLYQYSRVVNSGGKHYAPSSISVPILVDDMAIGFLGIDLARWLNQCGNSIGSKLV